MKSLRKFFIIFIVTTFISFSSLSAATRSVLMSTNYGDIVITLNSKAAPDTVKNFMRYIRNGFYNGTIIHQIVPNMLIKGGTFTVNMKKKRTRGAIKSEAANGLTNKRGTIAMSRRSTPNTATSEFFFNLKDNALLDHSEKRGEGFTVFGKVVKGLNVIDKIATVKTGKKGRYYNVPIEPVIIKKVRII